MKKNSGFSFVEVMVCVAILSTGLLGLLGLQARGLKNNVSANQRTQATLLGYAIIDKMRANKNEALKGATSTYVAAFNTGSTILSSTPDANCLPTGTPGTSCKSANMAVSDLVQWSRELTQRFCGEATTVLCNGKPLGRITYTAPLFTITISWDDNRNDIVDDRDPVDPTKPCYADTVTLPTLSSTPAQFDPCFRTSFQL